MKRAIRIVFKDGTSKDLELSKATSVKTKDKMLHLDELKDKTWRVIWNADLFQEFSQVERFDIIRED